MSHYALLLCLRDILIPGVRMKTSEFSGDRSVEIKIGGDSLYLVEGARRRILLDGEEVRDWPTAASEVHGRIYEFLKDGIQTEPSEECEESLSRIG
jgi:hypothetical protein